MVASQNHSYQVSSNTQWLLLPLFFKVTFIITYQYYHHYQHISYINDSEAFSPSRALVIIHDIQHLFTTVLLQQTIKSVQLEAEKYKKMLKHPDNESHNWTFCPQDTPQKNSFATIIQVNLCGGLCRSKILLLRYPCRWLLSHNITV